MENAHERLARFCMTYIVICLQQMKEITNLTSNVPRERRAVLTTSQESQGQPLLKYVLSYGFGHLSYLGPDNTSIFKDLKSLQTVILKHTWEWDQICGLVPSARFGVPWPTLRHDFVLYTLVAFASEALFRTYVHRTAVTSREGTNPLVYAAYLGRTDHAEILISAGVDINLQGLVVEAMGMDESDEDGSDSGLSDVGDVIDCQAIPLEVAVVRWHADVVDILLAKGCIVPDRLLSRVLGEQAQEFPLYIISRFLQTAAFIKWAATPWNNRGLLEALVDDAEDRGQADDREELVLASRKLVEVGCAETLLLLAVEKGCISVVEALLSMDLPSTLGGASRGRLFHLNARRRHVNMYKSYR